VKLLAGTLILIHWISSEESVFWRVKLIEVLEPGFTWLGVELAEQLERIACVCPLGHAYKINSNTTMLTHRFFNRLDITRSHSKC
jgi:hypothetical protein